MKLISAHDGQLVEMNASAWTDSARPAPFTTGLPALDAILPPGGVARGAVHEMLYADRQPEPVFVAMVLAKRASKTLMTKPETRIKSEARNPNDSSFTISSFGFDSEFGLRHSDFSRAIIWSDPHRTLYPPALFAAGVNPCDLWLLHPRSEQEELWAVAECLRCRGVAATVAQLPAKLHRNDARRLQLAAERGGGVGIIMRPFSRGAEVYAAATRWLIEPARGERTIQRWKITLLHGHGGQIGKSIILERCRENHLVRAVDELVDRPGIAEIAIA